MAKLQNSDFPNFFIQLNNLFDRAFNWNRGSVAPTNDVVPGEFWVDSGNQNKLKVRNDANNAWIDTQLRTDQPYWGLDPATAQFNAGSLQGRPIGSTTPTNGQALHYNGSQWIPRAGGKILQVAYGFNNVQVSNTSSTFVDTGLNASITPQFANSNILVLYSLNGIYKQGTTSVNVQIRRDSTNLTTVNLGGTGNASDLGYASSSNSFLNVPNSTSALNYRVFISNANNSGTVFCQYSNLSLSTIILMEVAN
ncbi:hypothetical protein LEP3755_34280 [Leptolyngbya sp. NIES-3755]|nr:hypothetical protein LEP3755_34280 [Leptolyngbya sp. NIES-3755]